MTSEIEATARSIQQLSKQYKSLVEKCKSLFADLDAHTASVLHHMDRIKKKLGVSSTLLCTICLHTAVNHTLQPCGHSYCQECATKCRTQRSCFSCRATVRSIQKIFLD